MVLEYKEEQEEKMVDIAIGGRGGQVKALLLLQAWSLSLDPRGSKDSAEPE